MSSARTASQFTAVSGVDVDHEDVEVSQLTSSLAFNDAFLEDAVG